MCVTSVSTTSLEVMVWMFTLTSKALRGSSMVSIHHQASREAGIRSLAIRTFPAAFRHTGMIQRFRCTSWAGTGQAQRIIHRQCSKNLAKDIGRHIDKDSILVEKQARRMRWRPEARAFRLQKTAVCRECVSGWNQAGRVSS